MRLFVDCDETLVLWDDTHQNQDKTLWVRDSWHKNDNLIAAVRAYLKENKECSLIIWSGGGADYAASWARRFFGDDEYVAAISKDIRIPEEFDICVDDEELKVKSHCWSPNYFIDGVFSQRGQ